MLKTIEMELLFSVQDKLKLTKLINE